MNSVKADVLGDIAAHIADERILRDPDVVSGLSHDEAEWAPVGVPLAVVRAESSADVQEVVRACHRHRVPVVARGAGTGLSGGANAVDGCVVVALDRMDRIVEIDPLERLAVVQPGWSTTTSAPLPPSTVCGIRRIRRVRRGRRSAAMSPPTPAGCAA